jgi:hypothetical protein
MPPVSNPASLTSSSPASKVVAVIDEIGTCRTPIWETLLTRCC